MKNPANSTVSRIRSVTGLVLCIPVVALVLGIAACLPVPVGDPETSKIDKDLVGIWLQQDRQNASMYVVHAYDKRTYLINMYNYKDGDSTIEAESQGQMKGWLTQIGGKQFITMDIISDQVAAGLEKKEAFYIVARIEKNDKGISLWSTNPDAPHFKGVKTREQAEAILKKHVNNPKIYTEKPLPLRRLGDDDKELVKTVFEIFGVD